MLPDLLAEPGFVAIRVWNNLFLFGVGVWNKRSEQAQNGAIYEPIAVLFYLCHNFVELEKSFSWGILWFAHIVVNITPSLPGDKSLEMTTNCIVF